jgi:hypothetical protein
MSGEHNILYDSSRNLFCYTFFFNYIKGSIYKIISYPLLYKGEDFFMMPRNQLTKEEIKWYIERLKAELYQEKTSESKYLADKYLNKVLDKIGEYYC